MMQREPLHAREVEALSLGVDLVRQLRAVMQCLNGQAYSSTLSRLNEFDAALRRLKGDGRD